MFGLFFFSSKRFLLLLLQMATERRTEGWRTRWSRDGEEAFGVQKHLPCSFRTSAMVCGQAEEHEPDEVFDLTQTLCCRLFTRFPPSLSICLNGGQTNEGGTRHGRDRGVADESKPRRGLDCAYSKASSRSARLQAFKSSVCARFGFFFSFFVLSMVKKMSKF